MKVRKWRSIFNLGRSGNETKRKLPLRAEDRGRSGMMREWGSGGGVRGLGAMHIHLFQKKKPTRGHCGLLRAWTHLVLQLAPLMVRTGVSGYVCVCCDNNSTGLCVYKCDQVCPGIKKIMNNYISVLETDGKLYNR